MKGSHVLSVSQGLWELPPGVCLCPFMSRWTLSRAPEPTPTQEGFLSATFSPFTCSSPPFSWLLCVLLKHAPLPNQSPSLSILPGGFWRAWYVFLSLCHLLEPSSGELQVLPAHCEQPIWGGQGSRRRGANTRLALQVCPHWRELGFLSVLPCLARVHSLFLSPENPEPELPASSLRLSNVFTHLSWHLGLEFWWRARCW